MDRLANELIFSISWHLKKEDAKNFGLTCKRIHGCMLNRIWNHVKFTECPSRKDFRALQHLPFKKLHVRSFRWQCLPTEIIEKISSLTDLVFDSKIDNWREIQALKNCKFTFHISTKFLFRQANIIQFARLLKQIFNVRLSIEDSFRPLTLQELEYLIGIPIERLNSTGVCLCGQSSDPVDKFIDVVNLLKPASITLGRSPLCCAETGLLSFNEQDLEVLHNWPVTKFYTGFFGFPHAHAPPMQTMKKLLALPTLKEIYVEHCECDDTKNLCNQRNITIRSGSVSPYF